MYTRCPECQTVFRVTKAQLALAMGKVRCGKCGNIFNARGNLFDELPEDTSDTPSALIEERPAPASIPAGVPASEIDHIELSSAPIAEETGDETGTESLGEPVFPEPTAPPSTEPSNEFDAILKGLDAQLAEFAEKSGIHHELPTNPPDKQAYIHDEPELEEAAEDWKTRGEYAANRPDELRSTDSDRAHIASIFDEVSEQLESNDEPESEVNQPQDMFTDMLTSEPKSATEPTTPEIEDVFVARAPQEPAETIPQDKEMEIEALPEQAGADAILEESITAEAEPPTDPHGEEPTSTPDIVEFSLTGKKDQPFETDEIPFRLRESLQAAKKQPRSWSMSILLAGVIIILLLGLLLQIVLFRNVQLAHRFPALQPVLDQTCQHLPCRYSGPRDIGKIQLLSRDVRSHPKQDNALLISASILNQASFPQPYPDILVTLSDITGNVVAQRRFTPAEYLGPFENQLQLMEPGIPVHVKLAILDPGRDAINFEFAFM